MTRLLWAQYLRFLVIDDGAGLQFPWSQFFPLWYIGMALKKRKCISSREVAAQEGVSQGGAVYPYYYKTQRKFDGMCPEQLQRLEHVCGQNTI